MRGTLEEEDYLRCHGHERDEAGYFTAGPQKGPPLLGERILWASKGHRRNRKKTGQPRGSTQPPPSLFISARQFLASAPESSLVFRSYLAARGALHVASPLGALSALDQGTQKQ